MQRTELMKDLKGVSPALAPNSVIPILSHFWFTGHYVMAYNDVISIRVPCKSDFVGAVPGKTLMDLLSRSRARKVDIQHTEQEAIVKAASSRIKLGVLPESDFIFEFPESNEGSRLKCTEEVLAAMKMCLMSTGHDSSVPEQLGVTCRMEGDRLVMYSTNGATLSCVRLKLGKRLEFSRNIILPADFCKQVLVFASAGKSILTIADDFSMLDTGRVQVFGRLIESENPLNFSDVVREHVGDRLEQSLVQIPTKLRWILERAAVITDIYGDQRATTIKVQDGLASFVSISDRGEIKDRMQLKDHPNASTKVEPSLVKAGYSVFDHLKLTESCVIMSKRTEGMQAFYLVAARS